MIQCKSKDAEKRKKERVIKKWMKENSDFVDAMNQFAFEIAKGSWGRETKFNSDFVRGMLEESGYKDLPFTATELIRVWKKL